MARKYRVIHERRNMVEALFAGGARDCYQAQAGGLFGWRTIATCATVDEAEAACRDHAGGTLLPGGKRIVSEFERPD